MGSKHKRAVSRPAWREVDRPLAACGRRHPGSSSSPGSDPATHAVPPFGIVDIAHDTGRLVRSAGGRVKPGQDVSERLRA